MSAQAQQEAPTRAQLHERANKNLEDADQPTDPYERAFNGFVYEYSRLNPVCLFVHMMVILPEHGNDTVMCAQLQERIISFLRTKGFKDTGRHHELTMYVWDNDYERLFVDLILA